MGGVLKELNLGAIGNTIAGAIGGGAASQAMAMFSPAAGAAPLAGMAAAGSGDMGSLIGAVVAGGAGGGALTGMIAMAKKMMGGGE